MFNKLSFTLFFLMTFATSIAQKGVRIAYIDFNEIIEEISDYREAIQSLESKAQNWNKEIFRNLIDLPCFLTPFF